MKILGLEINRKNVQNASPTPAEGAKKRRRVSETVNAPRPDRIKMQMDKLRLALESAQDPDNPDWKDLYSLYEDAMTDDEVIAQTEIATDKLEAEPFALTVNETDDDELTKLFKSKWFTDFLYIRFAADLWGYQLAEAGYTDANGHFLGFSAFNLKNISRKKRQVLVNDYDLSGIPFGEKPEQLFLIELGNTTDTGLLEVITRLVIQKAFAEGDWDRYNEKYNMPHVVIGTDADGKELDAIEKAAKNFNQNSYFVGDIDVNQVKLLESAGAGSAYMSYKSRIDDKNKAIAKIINGQQATTEAQAWTGTAQVQKETYVDKHTSRLRRYSNDINEKLIPFLRYHGYPIPEGAVFRFPVLDDRQATPIEDVPAEETATGAENRLRIKPINSKYNRPLSLPKGAKKKCKALVASTGSAANISETYQEYTKQVKLGTQIDITRTSYTDPRFKLINNLQADAARFATFREAQKERELAAADDAAMRHKIETRYNEYLKTEKHAIFANSAAAERWMGFEENADLYPNLEWRTAGDSDVRPDHARLDGLVLPINDPFWGRNTPPLDFGCRCELVQTDAKVVQKEGYEITQAHKGFDFNPGIDQKLFSDSAGYYTSPSKKEAERLNKTAAGFYRKESRKWGKEALNKSFKTSLGTVKINATGLNEVLNQPHKEYELKNMLMENPGGLLKGLKFTQIADFKNNPMIKSYYYAEIKLGSSKSWVICREKITGEINLYTIIDNLDQYLNKIK